MNRKINGNLIKEARQELCISQADLARALGLSRAAVSDLEGGKTANPSAETLANLSAFLRKPVDFFYSDYASEFTMCTPVTFRSFSNASKRDNTATQIILTRFSLFLQYILKFVSINPLDLPDGLKGNVPDSLASDKDIEELSSSVRGQWALDDLPVVNLITQMENHGIICLGYELPDTIDSVNATFVVRWKADERRYPVIIFNSNLTYFRQRFTVAHELGHILLHSGWTESMYEAYHKEAERQAHLFANSFMMPREAFAGMVKYSNVSEAIRLKSFWRMSAASIGRRMYETGKLDAEHLKYFYIDLSKRGWRKREPGDEAFAPEKPYLIEAAYRLAFDKRYVSSMDVLSHFNLYQEDIVKFIGNKEKFAPSPSEQITASKEVAYD